MHDVANYFAEILQDYTKSKKKKVLLFTKQLLTREVGRVASRAINSTSEIDIFFLKEKIYSESIFGICKQTSFAPNQQF